MENSGCSLLRQYKDFNWAELTGTGLEFHAHTGDVNLIIHSRRTSHINYIYLWTVQTSCTGNNSAIS